MLEGEQKQVAFKSPQHPTLDGSFPEGFSSLPDSQPVSLPGSLLGDVTGAPVTPFPSEAA